MGALLASFERRLERLLTATISPAPAAGQTTLFLLATMLVTGVYLFFFYRVDWPGAYTSVATMSERNVFGALLRGVHRHGADILLLVALWHLTRSLITSRGEKGYKIAWLTGAGLLLFFAAQGVTGYLLPLDLRGEAILRRLLNIFPFPESFVADFAASDTVSGAALVYVVALHLIPPIIGAMLLGAHLARQGQRPRLWPSKGLMLSFLVGLGVAAVMAPATSLPQALFDRFPTELTGDPLFLWPVALMAKGTTFWGALTLIVVVAVGVPFLLRRPVKPLVTVDADRCVGCRLCYEDCPKIAITMAPRRPEERHPWIAVVDPTLCQGCATCVGSCGFDALSLSSHPTDAIADARADVAGKTILYGCAAACGGENPLGENPLAEEPSVTFIPLACAGQLSPSWVTDDFAHGAERIVIARCSTLRCLGRDGALFVEERLTHRRRPWPPRRRLMGRLTLVDMAPGQTEVLRQALALPPTGDRIEMVEAGGPGRSIIGALLLALMVAGSALALDRWGQNFAIPMTEAESRWGAIRVEGFKPMTVTFTIDGDTIASYDLTPPRPLAPLLAYRRFPLPHETTTLTATVTEKGADPVSVAWKGTTTPGSILLFRFDAAREGLTPPPVVR